MTDQEILVELKDQIPSWDKGIEYYSKKLKECEDSKARTLRLIEVLEEKISDCFIEV